MSKILKDEKIFNKFKKNYSFIFNNETIKNLLENHFNKNGSFIVFTLSILQNKVGGKAIFNHAKINLQDWISLFENLYSDEQIKKVFEIVKLNPLQDLAAIQNMFVCFKPFAEKLIDYLDEQELKININKNAFVQTICDAFGYFLYNDLEVKINQNIKDIIEDKHYDKKVTIILNNIKLFAVVKKHIQDYCGEKINDLIVLVLGGSNHLALIK